MKRKLLAVALASLFALPVFAMDRDEPYDDANYAPSASASASQPRDALVTERRAGEAVLEPASAGQPRDGLVAERRAGEAVLELGRSIN
jgi:hypothetical protein